MSDVIDRVRKLLAKSERAGTPEESEIYMEKATSLIAKHGIDEALLAASGERLDEVESREYTFTGSYQIQQAVLLHRIASALRCQSVRYQGQRGGGGGAVVVGFASDLERVDLLYSSLNLQMLSQVKDVTPDYWSNESTRGFRVSWAQGFSARVMTRLEEAEKKAVNETESTGAELVLRDRSAEVDSRYQSMFPNVKKDRRKVGSASGYSAGVQAGNRADLGNKRVGGSRTALAW